ncbi:KH domain-containing protein [filamentous cyanobacterium LEGE 11480]|uniref:KH domain-containing protein n=1 Tax=Romeriopsis navalis LEGE 11480 TaxID=2777977 RepID=A0A928VHT5_9CYAN|nr:KH domain-containing protein [Romeriopsis navalis]MBE9028605.1 KH domain-containing protein [Romeriopsis navalis LEGE 11480]
MSAPEAIAQSPNYAELAKFLLQPFLAVPEALKVNAEFSHAHTRVLIRVAFDEAEDRGRVFGRGGRNIKAVSTTIEGIAQVAGQSARLQVFGTEPEQSSRGTHDRRPSRPSSSPPKPKPKPKT